MPYNPFATHAASPTGLGLGFMAVTPAATDLSTQLRQIHVGTAPAGGGSLRVTGVNGAVVTFVGLSAGTTLPGPFVRIHATGTTVSDLVGWI